MADILDELLNSGSVDASSLAAQLRNQREHGMVAALSGSKRLGPYGENMEQQALEQAGHVGDVRRDQQNAADSAAAELNKWKAAMAQREREGKLDRDSDAALRREGFANARDIAHIRVRNAKKDVDEAAAYEGKKQVSDIASNLRSYYDTLNSGGGIVSTAKGGISNATSRIQSTGIGQTLGGAFGTDNQQQRAQIKQQRPLLLQAIKNATGMSAQQMNSNVELQLWLEAATDPTIGYEANLSALEQLDNLYGLGDGTGGIKAPASSDNPAGIEADVWNAMSPEEQALWATN